MVVAIRGTVSLADLVTDAVVHPEPLHDWLSAATRKVTPPSVARASTTLTVSVRLCVERLRSDPRNV